MFSCIDLMSTERKKTFEKSEYAISALLNVLSTAAVTNLSCIMGLLVWRPHPNQMTAFFVFPSLWGMADAIWQTQTNGKYSNLL